MRLSIISKGDARRTTPDKTFEGSFEEFAELFENYRPNKGKHDGYFTRGELVGTRKNANLPEGQLIILDGDQSIDNESSAPDPLLLHKALKLIKVNHFIYTTHSYAPPEKIKWRCVIPCLMSDQSQLKPTLELVFSFLKSIDYPLVNVKENWTWSQPWFLPNRAEDDGHYIYLSYFKGKDYQPANSSPESTQEHTTTSGSSHAENLGAIREGLSYYKELQNILYGMAKDGRSHSTVLADAEMIMMASKASYSDHTEHDKWQSRFAELPTYVNQAFSSIVTLDDVNIEDIPDHKQLTPADINLDYPPGLMGQLCKDFFDMAPHPNQEISIMGGICLVAGIVGRKYNVMGTGLNIYATLLADSGIGKAVLKDGINLALRSASAMNGALYMGSSRFTGPKAIFDMLAGGHSRVCVLEESGLMNESKAGDGAGINRVLLDLYTSSGVHQWAGGEAYSDKNNSVAAIQAPALTVLNVSTPKSYLRAMKSKSAELSGEIARMWMIRSIREKPYLNIDRKRQFSEDVLERLGEMTTFCMDRQIPTNMGEVVDVKFSGEKYQVDSNKFVDFENKYREEGDHLRRTLCSRAFVKIMKLAAVCSVFNGHEGIGDDEYNWARETVKHEMDFIQDTFTHEASDDLLSVSKSVICVAILDALRRKYKTPNKVPSEKMIKANIVTYSIISQIVQNNVVLKDLDDDPARPNPRKGVEKCIDYMVRVGLLYVVEKSDLKMLGSRSSKAYKITDDFKTLMMDHGWDVAE